MTIEPGFRGTAVQPSAGPPADAQTVAPVRVTLVGRANCHLCDDAKAVLARLASEHGIAWHELDVDADPQRADTYGDRVPVILVDGREHGYWRVEEARLLRALAEAS